MRFLAIGFFVICLWVGAGIFPAAAADCLICPSPAEDSLVSMINQYRTGLGLPALMIDARLIASARRQAGDMIRNDFLGFEGTDGSTSAQRLLDAGYAGPGAENLVVQSEGAAETFGLLSGAGSVTSNWLDPAFYHIGVAYLADQIGTATSAWAIDYGGESGAPAEPACRVIYCPDEIESQLLGMINLIRIDNELPLLQEDARLVVSAQSHACEMGLYYFVSQSSIDGRSGAERMLAAGYASPGPTLIASGLANPQATVDDWMADPIARQYLLDPSVVHAGVGLGGDGLGPVPYGWVVDLGLATESAIPPDCGCCVGERGNVNADLGEAVNLTDLTVLVNHLFVTFEPIFCEEEANVSGDAAGSLTLTDLTVLVNHLFVTFEPLSLCP